MERRPRKQVENLEHMHNEEERENESIGYKTAIIQSRLLMGTIQTQIKATSRYSFCVKHRDEIFEIA